MRRFLLLPLLLLAGCQSSPPPDNSSHANLPENGGAFGNEKPPKEPADGKPRIVVDTNDVAQFRGTKMPVLVARMDSDDRADWFFVRRHVHPAPAAPADYDKDGREVRRRFQWPPAGTELSDPQRAWRSYLLWPEHIRTLLHGNDWDSAPVRARLAGYGRMYELIYKFQNTPEYASQTRESEHWRSFAENMLAWGKDGEALLVSNMVLALTNPREDVVLNAQSILVQVGEGAIEPLCAALWTGYRRRVVLDDGRQESQGSPNFNKYVIETLYRIGPRATSQAIYELENSLDDNGVAGKSAWRFRKHFVELLGRLGDSRAIRTIEAEIGRVQPQEFVEAELRQGREVPDEVATDHAKFVYREYLLLALRGIAAPECLRPLLKIWKMDPDHETGAVDALTRIATTAGIDAREAARLNTMDDARALARKLKVDLNGE